MSTYIIVGKMGTGKTKAAVRIMQDAFNKGLKVVSNVDLYMEKLVQPMSKNCYIRVPDKPTVEDLECIGQGNDSYDEDLNGIIILDELAAWMNARTFNDKNRQPVLDWLIHSRKKGWHVYFICQDLSQIDKQLREALCEYVVRCTRVDKIKIPMIGTFLQLINKNWGKFPRMHIATTRLGTARDGMLSDKLYYKGDDLHKAYDTRQVFTDGYPNGPHSVLSAWHVYGRYLAMRKLTWWDRLLKRSPIVKRPVPQFGPVPLHIRKRHSVDIAFRAAREYCRILDSYGTLPGVRSASGGVAELPRLPLNKSSHVTK